MNNFRYTPLFVALSFAAGNVAQSQTLAAATSSSTAESNLRFDEVIVTANRREESGQKVPVSMTVLSQEQLAADRILTAQDMQGRVPSLVINGGGTNRNSEAPAIRGMGRTIGGFPGVITYFAEAAPPTNNITGSQGGGIGLLFDVESLQVLKGPQGTLFGRNTTGGAIVIEPHKPTDRYEGYIQGESGNYDMRRVETVINTPVSDTLSLRFSGNYMKRDGFTEDAVTGKDYDDKDRMHLRLGALWRPTDAVTNYLVGYYFKSNENGTSVLASYSNPANAAGVAAVELQKQLGIRKVINSADPIDKTNTFMLIDKLDIELSDRVTLRNILSYSRYRSTYRYDFDGTGLVRNDHINSSDQENWSVWQYSEELQLQGRADEERLNWIVGGYIDKSAPYGDGSKQTAQTATSLATTISSIERESKAVYGQVSYDLGGIADALDRLTATLGARYTWDSTRTKTDRLPGGLDVKEDSSEPTWTAGLDYQISNDVMAYAKASQGYKQGGTNPFAVDSARATYDPEYVKSYEVGIKSMFDVGSVPVRANISYYHNKFTDMQRSGVDFNSTLGIFGAQTFNVGKATIEGVELELTVRPFELLELSGNYAYMDAHYDDYVLTDFTGTADLTSAPFQYAPMHQWSATARLTLPVPATWGEMYANATYVWQDDTWAGATTTPQADPDAWINSYHTLNMSMNWDRLFGSALDASLFVTNATDEEFRVSYLATRSQGFAGAAWSEPRMYGLSLRYNFGR